MLPCTVSGEGLFEKAFIDVRVFNPCAQSNHQSPLLFVYRRHEQGVREVEHASFTPLVMSVTGGMGKPATTIDKRLASMISEKRNTGVPLENISTRKKGVWFLAMKIEDCKQRLRCDIPHIFLLVHFQFSRTESFCDQKSPNSDITGATYTLSWNPYVIS